MRIEASPINPSDLGLLVGTVNVLTPTTGGGCTDAVPTLAIRPQLVAAMAGRLDESLLVGNEAAGTIIAAGAPPRRRLCLDNSHGPWWRDVRLMPRPQGARLPEAASHTTAAEAALCFVDPLTRSA